MEPSAHGGGPISHRWREIPVRSLQTVEHWASAGYVELCIAVVDGYSSDLARLLEAARFQELGSAALRTLQRSLAKSFTMTHVLN